MATTVDEHTTTPSRRGGACRWPRARSRSSASPRSRSACSGFIFASRSFTSTLPSGTVEGATFLGIEGNGWTWVVFAAAGLLLLLGSPIHWGAKSMAFIVGVAMVVGALISLSDGDDILGIVATNNWTTLVMGAGGAALIVLSMMPRVGRRRGGAPMATRANASSRSARAASAATARPSSPRARRATNGTARPTAPPARSKTAGRSAPGRGGVPARGRVS